MNGVHPGLPVKEEIVDHNEGIVFGWSITIKTLQGGGEMYQIKRYANGRFYDTVEKNYITREQISALIRSGKKVTIVNTSDNADITEQVVSQMKAKKTVKAKSKKTKEEGENIFVQLFRKGGDALSDYGKRYASMWQNMMTMSRDEIDKLVNMLVKDKKITEKEGSKLKSEIDKYRENIQKWITRNVDQRIDEMLQRMNLANRDQVVSLTGKIGELSNKIENIEKAIKKRAAAKKTVKPAKTAPKPQTTV